MKRLLFVIAMPAVLAGCDEGPPIQSMAAHGAQEIQTKPQDRIQVELIGRFRDSLAYSSTRGIYVITDHKTGSEYIGISGVGITEVGSHLVGKVSTEDER
jgi:hypothetical protein